MGYRWLKFYRPESRVAATAPGIFRIMLKNDDREYPVFGVSRNSVEEAIAARESELLQLRDILEKMKKE